MNVSNVRCPLIMINDFGAAHLTRRCKFIAGQVLVLVLFLARFISLGDLEEK